MGQLIDAIESRHDNNTVFIARELDKLEAQSYDIKKAELSGFRLVPVTITSEPGIETITYKQYDSQGLAKVIANYADDLPRSDVSMAEFTARVRMVGAAFGYNLQEIAAALTVGTPLEQRRFDQAVRSIMEKWNRVLFYGDPTHNLQGWLSNPNISVDTVAADGAGGGGSSTLWANKTADQIIRDMNDLANGIVDLTNGVEQPDTLVLPISRYTFIASTPRSANSDTTILEYFLKNNPFINAVELCNEITNAQRDANMDTDPFTGEIMIAYRRDPSHINFRVTQDAQAIPPQERNLEVIINMTSRIAGTFVYYPLGQAVGQGI